MMNGKDPFEQRLGDQPLRPVPADWRADILRAACAELAASQKVSPPVEVKSGWFLAIARELKTLLWLNSKAWVGLAAAWLLIALMNFSMQDSDLSVAKNPAPPSPAMLAELKQQRLMFAELVGQATSQDSDRPRNSR